MIRVFFPFPPLSLMSVEENQIQFRAISPRTLSGVREIVARNALSFFFPVSYLLAKVEGVRNCSPSFHLELLLREKGPFFFRRTWVLCPPSLRRSVNRARSPKIYFLSWFSPLSQFACCGLNRGDPFFPRGSDSVTTELFSFLFCATRPRWHREPDRPPRFPKVRF